MSQQILIKIARNFSSNNSPILKGYRVIDASRILVGSHACLSLAEMGAEVIKIEQKTGDDTRFWGPPFLQNKNGTYDSTYYMSLNRNKKSITIDLKHQLGVKIVQDLVQVSDIFVQNFLPKTLNKLELDYDSLKQYNKSLIYASVNGYPDGCLENKQAFDLTMQAMTGFMHITGDPNSSPQKVGYAVTDIITGQQLTTGIVSAILHRERTSNNQFKGEGQHIKTNMFQSSLYSLSYVVSCYLNGNQNYTRMGNDHPNIAPYSVYKTKDDQYIVIGVATNPQFFTFAKIIGLNTEGLEDNSKRIDQRKQLNEKIQNLLLQNFTLQQLKQVFTQQKIPFSEINSIQSLMQNDEIIQQNKQKPFMTTFYSENYKQNLSFINNPIEYEKFQNNNPSESPTLGQHTQSILRETLKYSTNQIDDLISQNII